MGYTSRNGPTYIYRITSITCEFRTFSRVSPHLKEMRPEDVCAAVSHPLGDPPATEDVQLYYLYHKLTSIRSKLRDKSLEYLYVLQIHPSCNEVRTQAILAECDSARHEPIDIDNEGSFPRTIDFLKELVIWHDSVMTKHEELKILIHNFDFETREASAWVEKTCQK